MILYCYYSYIAIVGNLAPQVIVIILMGDTPFDTYLSHCVSGLMVSIMALGKTCSEAKNSRLGTLKWVLENDFENLGMECYSIDGFQK
jgi:hypothetical protein